MTDRYTLERPLFFIAHLAQVGTILRSGEIAIDPDDADHPSTSIWDPAFTAKRRDVRIPFGDRLPLSQFVAMHATAKPPGLYNRCTGFNTGRIEVASIVLFVTNALTLAEHLVPFVVATHQPLSGAGEVLTALEGLDLVDWAQAASSDFRHDPNDPQKISRAGAEILAYRAIPLAAISKVICCPAGEAALREVVADTGVSSDLIQLDPRLFFAQPAAIRRP